MAENESKWKVHQLSLPKQSAGAGTDHSGKIAEPKLAFNQGISDRGDQEADDL